MARARRQNLRAVSVICGGFGLAGWAAYALAFSREPSQDWMVFHTAARTGVEGNLSLLFDGDRFTAAINQRFADLLSWPLPLHPWLYPPHFLLLLLPFGLLPFGVAETAFLLATFGGLVAATRLYAQDAGRRRLYLFSLLLCPAAAITVCLGQNAFLTSALLIGGFGLKERRPMLGGMLLGLLTYKPQLWITAPVALVALRQWRMLAAMTATALVVMAASVAAFGLEPWRAWIELMSGNGDLYRKWLVAGRLNGQSVYSCAVLLGASPTLANLAQAVAVASAAGSVYRTFRRPMGADLRVAVLLAATILAAPHTIGYDSVMLAFSATLLFCRGLDDGLRPGDTVIALLVWLSPLVNPPSLFWPGLLTPILIALLIACALSRGRRAAACDVVLSPARLR